MTVINMIAIKLIAARTILAHASWRFYRSAFPLLLVCCTGMSMLQAQETAAQDEILPGLEESAVILSFTARVIESNQEVTWNTSNSKVTISGKPVSIKLTGKNIVVIARFTPYINAEGVKFLTAQGQVWTDTPHEGVHYYTSIETIPLDFDEQIFFFPLGSQDSPSGTRIEIQLMLKPYDEVNLSQNNASSEHSDQ
jgi:hypothetical protein